jgi:integrase
MSPRPRKRALEILDEAEIGALIRACRHHSPIGRRNRALLSTIYRAALRIDEALALTPDDVDLDTGRIVVRRPRSGRRRVVGVGPGTLAILKEWLRDRTEQGISLHAPLFCSLNPGRNPKTGVVVSDRGQPLNPIYVRVMLKCLARRASIEKRVHPHGLRHARTLELASRYPAIAVQRWLGHSSLATTQLYLGHLQPQNLERIYREDDWQLDTNHRQETRA